jgi:LysM repeat protein
MNAKKVTIIVLLALLILLSFNLTAAYAGPAYPMPMPGFYYTVSVGDTLYSIAWRFHTNVWAVAQANGLINPSLIYVGQVLLISGSGPVPPVPPSPSPIPGPMIHVVRWGETVFSISRMYGISVWTLAYANGLPNPNYIYAGQRLIIPGPARLANPTAYPYPYWGTSGYPSVYPYSGGSFYGMPATY